MIEEQTVPLRPGDRAPDFELPAADREGRVALAEYRRRGPVLLVMLKGMAAAPDRAIHRAYRLPAAARTLELGEETERHAAEVLRELGLQAPPGQAGSAFSTSDGFEMTTEDESEWKRPLRSVGYFLIGRDGVIRGSRADTRIRLLPEVAELLALV
ncbi:MAG: hypothetical protein HY294_07450 [Candidatus Rokubacteria bacterium]|nr:hypothetical protein [Candidatus Rokubacteria bacterium]MBI3825813.1 hypothetical protein [Candidatus Rokubacteria bacterium]